MKICIISDLYYPYPGGVSEHVHHTAIELKKRGHKVIILTTNYKQKYMKSMRPNFYPLKEEEIRRIGRAIPRPINKSMGVVIVGWGLRRALRRILDEGFNVIHMHGPHASLPLRALRYSTSLNILTFHAAKPKGRTDKLIAQYVKKYVQKIHGAIAVSPDALSTMKYFIPTKYTIIPNGIDTTRFSPEVKPLPQFDDDSPTILFVGRFEPRKGLKYLLQAFRKIKKKIPKTRLIVVGKGWFTRVDVEEAKKEGIFFEGFVSVENLPRYYATADVFCSPAIGRESFGIVLLEAMSSGTPVVATNISGYKRVIKNGENGILVEPKDPQKLEEAIIKILTDTNLKEKLSSNARKEALKYSWTNITKKIEKFYYEIAEKEGIKLN